MATQVLYPPSERARTIAMSGAGAGALAGLGMALWLAVYAGGVGLGFWLPLHAIGALFYGPVALVRADAAALGLLTHLLFAAALGTLFFLAAPRGATRGALYLGGAAFGMGVWLVMTFLVVPIVNPTLHARIALTQTSWLIGHFVFGLVLAVLYDRADRG